MPNIFAKLVGPDGEMLKFVQTSGASRNEFGKHYCSAGTISSAYLDNYDVDSCKSMVSSLVDDD